MKDARVRAVRLLMALTVAFAALQFAVPLGAAPAAQPKIGLAAEAGFGDDGTFLIGEWFPVRVTLSNPAGGQSRRVRVEVDSQGDSFNVQTGTYVREVDLPASSRKEVLLYAYSSNFNRTLEVRVAQGDTVIDKVSVKVEPLERSNSIVVGVVSSDASLLNILKGESLGHPYPNFQSNTYGGSYGTTSSSGAPVPTLPSASIAHMELRDIPSLSAALSSLSALVLDDADTGTLTGEQRAALAAWVGRGGTLMVAARPGAAETVSGLADLLPVTVSGARTLPNLQSVGELLSLPITTTTSPIVPGAALKTEEGVRARVLAQEGGVPLVAVRDLGMGRVVYLGVSPALAPLKGWDGLTPMFKRLMAEHPLRISAGAMRRGNNSSSYGYYSSGKIYDTYGSIFDWPGLELPDPILIGVFLLVYIMVVGPVNFVVLRRKRRSEWAWLTIPALVALFSVGAYALAFQAKGGELVAMRANALYTTPDLERADAVQYIGLFSPVRDTYRLEVGEESAVSEINSNGYSPGSPETPIQVVGGKPTGVGNIQVNTWALRGFMAENELAAQSPLEADLRVGNNVIEGAIRNRSGEGLESVALIRGDAIQRIDYMAPGQSVDVKLSLSSRPFASSSPTDLITTPPGVTAPTGYNYGYGSQPDSPEQRAYNRRLELLNMTLYPLVSDLPSTEMEVLAVAWGPGVPSNLSLVGRTVRYDEINMWTSHLPIRGDGETRLGASSVPFWLYVPGEAMPWTAGPASAPIITALDPYADIHYSLPGGVRPNKLAFSYKITGDAWTIEVQAHNIRTGRWDRLGDVQSVDPSQAGDASNLDIPNPADYVGNAGDVTLRLIPRGDGGSVGVSLVDINLILNDGQ